MNKQKLTYLSPVTETLVVRFEGVICQSNPVSVALFANFGDANAAGASFTEDLGYDL